MSPILSSESPIVLSCHSNLVGGQLELLLSNVEPAMGPTSMQQPNPQSAVAVQREHINKIPPCIVLTGIMPMPQDLVTPKLCNRIDIKGRSNKTIGDHCGEIAIVVVLHWAIGLP